MLKKDEEWKRGREKKRDWIEAAAVGLKEESSP